MTQRILSLALVLACFGGALDQTLADNVNNRQRRFSTEALATTATGKRLLSHFANEEEYYSLYTIGDLWTSRPRSLYETRHWDNNIEFRLNGELLAATPMYASWVLAQALVRQRAAKVATAFGIPPMPNFVEFSQWSFLLAMRHWEEAGAPNEEDYAKHPNKNISAFPIALQASVSKWHSIWRSRPLNSFLQNVKARHKKLGYGNKTLVGYSRTAPTEQERAAATTLLEAFRADIASECQRRPQSCNIQ